MNFTDIIRLFDYIGDLTSEKSQKTTSPKKHIPVTILGADNSVATFKIQPHIPFRRLAEKYCQITDTVREDIRFRFDGNAINNDEPVGSFLTPTEYTIEVFVRQTGGSDAETNRENPPSTSDSTSSSDNQKNSDITDSSTTVTTTHDRIRRARTICDPNDSNEQPKQPFESCNNRHLRMKKAQQRPNSVSIHKSSFQGGPIYQTQPIFNIQCKLCCNRMQNTHNEGMHELNRQFSLWGTSKTNRPLQMLVNIERLLKNTYGNITISLEGNIAAGKTTIIKRLGTLGSPNITTLREPLNNWCAFHNMNLLEAAYNKPKKWAAAFQTYAITTMAKNHLKQAPIKIMERSMESIKNVFIQAHKKQANFPTVQGDILLELIELISSELPTAVNMYIYLRTEPSVAYERLRMRNRAEEQNVSLDYLQLLHELHEKWLYTKAGSNVITIDANQNIEMILRELNMKIGQHKIQ